jgi:Icc protein
MSRPFFIAQLSDLHVQLPGQLLSGRVDMSACLARAVARVNSLDPPANLVMFTGDLVDSGSGDEYRELRRLVEPLTVPFHFIPGNHDVREVLRETFPAHAYLEANGEFIQYTLEDFPVRIIALDTLDPGQESGLMDEPRLDWIAAELSKAPNKPTIVFMHHPPFAGGIEYMDEINCRGAEAFERIIRKHPQVELIACGHVHRPIQKRWAGTFACVAPSVAHQIALDLREDPLLRFVLEPPAFLLHMWRPDTGVVTHIAYVDKFPGPYSFD